MSTLFATDSHLVLPSVGLPLLSLLQSFATVLKNLVKNTLRSEPGRTPLVGVSFHGVTPMGFPQSTRPRPELTPSSKHGLITAAFHHLGSQSSNNPIVLYASDDSLNLTLPRSRQCIGVAKKIISTMHRTQKPVRKW